MVDIYSDLGSLLSCVLTFEELHQMMMDTYVSENTFIRFKFQDGRLGAVRKRAINAYCESENNGDEE